MILFTISVFTGCIGMLIGAQTSGNEFFINIGATLGFSLPYAIVIQSIYKDIQRKKECSIHGENCLDKLSDNICPACGSKISPVDEKCFICGIPLTVENQ